MRILHITSRLTAGGSEQQLGLLVRGLRERGHEVQVCCLGECGRAANELRQEGIAVQAFGGERVLDPRPLSRLWKHLKQWLPDVIHTWRPMGNAVGRAVALRYRKAPVVATAHYPESSEPGWQRWLVRRLHRGTAKWIVPVPGLTEFWRERSVRDEKLAVIPPGVIGTEDRRRGEELRRQANLPANCPLLLMAGRLLPRKGFKEAIWTLDILKYIHPDVHLLIAGEGPDRPRLEQFAHDIQIASHVRFLGWRDDLQDWLHTADIVWVPSLRDDLPDFALEALAAGKPVVASRLPAFVDVIADGTTGFLVPPGDKPALARQTRMLLEHQELRQQFGAAARTLIQERFQPATMIDRHLELYEQVSARPAVPAST